ncbi:hypothetical protein D915_008353 [Fasciola hepatica]|uniref:Uncharacterized protein n=1 Tax=Fasciola hepatica TaxID=6192 RepID=A0A4E0R3Y2_FASHE|nr:hypothetical protein D915_008353 [Fasciola hepatica]
MVIVRFGPFLGKFRVSENRNGDKKNGADEYRYESVPIYDIIDMSHASRHRISAGDKVLARGLWPVPVSSGNKKDTHHNIRHIRYLPATVFEEMVNEELPNEADKRKFPPSEDSATNVRVELALPGPRAGCYKLPKANVVWIPTAVFERIVLEQLLPTEAREWVHHKTFPLGIYPDTAAPGYPHEDSQRLSFWRSSLAIHPIQYVQLEVGREKQLDCNPEPQTAPVIFVTKELNSIARATHSWRENPVESNQSSEVDRIKVS